VAQGCANNHHGNGAHSAQNFRTFLFGDIAFLRIPRIRAKSPSLRIPSKSLPQHLHQRAIATQEGCIAPAGTVQTAARNG
jgi:hypothetical protein